MAATSHDRPPGSLEYRPLLQPVDPGQEGGRRRTRYTHTTNCAPLAFHAWSPPNPTSPTHGGGIGHAMGRGATKWDGITCPPPSTVRRTARRRRCRRPAPGPPGMHRHCRGSETGRAPRGQTRPAHTLQSVAANNTHAQAHSSGSVSGVPVGDRMRYTGKAHTNTGVTAGGAQAKHTQIQV